MKRFAFATVLLSCCLAPFGSAQGAADRALGGAEGHDREPNILLILLDDAGYGDIAGFGGSRADTPTLKQLGDKGVRFTRFYADATCRPARVSLLTGKQASRVVLSPDFHGISPEVETLPEKLKQAGYVTYHIGKWHLGDTTKLSWPLAEGFDHWFGFLNQFVLRGPNEKGELVPHRPTYMNPWLQTDDGKAQQFQGHVEDILADRVIDTINQLKGSRAPWFINYWTLAPHNPATPAERYRKQFPATKAGQYSALMKQVDDEIGRVLAALTETGQADNTIVVVLSDNGGTNELETNNGPFAGEKASFGEGGLRTPMIMYWGKQLKHAPSPQSWGGIATIYDLYPTLLAAASISATDTDGVDLTPLVREHKPRPPQPLFWELGSDFVYVYSVLDASGRWRLDGTKLYDLEADPAGSTDVASKFPDKAEELRQLFLAWRKDVHHLKLDVQVLHRDNMPDAWRVTGDSFRRSPGYGGFTFVTSITPDKGAAPAGVIAEQAGMWKLEILADHRMHLRMHDHEVYSAPVAITGCTPLVLSTYYLRSKLQPRQDHGVWVLTLGDRQVLGDKWSNASVFPDRFLEPTFVGQSADGRNRFNAVLESPQFYNEFYYRNDVWHVDRDPGWLAHSTCRDKG